MGKKGKIEVSDSDSDTQTSKSKDIEGDKGKEPIHKILYEALCPRLPAEGFFGPINTPYVTPEGAQDMKTYVYKGGDFSPIYNYVLSPMANKCVEFLPTWIAPNTITLISFILAIVNTAILAMHSWDFSVSVPIHLWGITGLTILLYQLLDNMDGKQARRTKTGSPLGLLFDHGIDANNNGLLVVNILVLFRITCPIRSTIVFISQQLPFVFCTWEEFFLGELYLPTFNGPTEGLLLYASLCLSTWFSGTDKIWEIPLDFMFPESLKGYFNTLDILIFLYFIAFVQSVFFNLIKVFGSSSKDRKFKRRHAYGALVPLLHGLWLTAVISFFPDTSLVTEYPRLLYMFLSVLFASLSIHLQLAHIQSMHFYPWRKTFILPLAILALNNLLRWYNIHIVNPGHLLWFCFIVSLLSLSQMCLRTVIEVSNALDITVFTVPRLSMTAKKQ